MGSLYFGDNLSILREHIQSDSIDLIYLDPPFNSKRDYNLLFRTPKGLSSDAQITAFEDSWHWGEQAEQEFSEILRQPNTDVSEMIQSLRRFLKESDMMAYLVMMANRLLDLHRTLKPTGSLYLHCDPTASHYLKIVLDSIFGAVNFRSHITWKRSDTHNDAKNRYSAISDHILFYVKTSAQIFNVQRTPHTDSHIANWFTNLQFPDGTIRRMTKEEIKTGILPAGSRRFSISDMSSPNPRPNLMYEYKGYPFPSKGWRHLKSRMEQLDADGRLLFPSKPDGRIVLKKFLDEQEGVVIGDIWTDITQLRAQDAERMGYPTQKPLSLLERIIRSSSNEGDIVLDPFCGCGTAVHAAQSLNRNWIGIDITHLAINLIEKRMKSAFPNLKFEVHGRPTDLAGARELAYRDKYQFQSWACYLVNAPEYHSKKKGADGGIDGMIFFQDDSTEAKKIIVSIKGGENVGVTQVKDLIATVQKEKAEIGLFVTLAEPTRPMTTEAVSAGFYHSPFGDFPKIQILTIEGLLSGNQTPKYPDLSHGSHSFKPAKVEEKRASQDKLL